MGEQGLYVGQSATCRLYGLRFLHKLYLYVYLQEIETFLEVGEQGLYGRQSATSFVRTALLTKIILVCVFAGDRDVFRGW